MRLSIACAIALPLLLSACGGHRGRVRVEGQFLNLNQADFLIYSPTGALPDIDTLHLLKGKFRKDLAVAPGEHTYTIIYPNYATLSFTASDGARVRIDGDALALAAVRVTGADTAYTSQPQEPQEPLRVGMKLPKVDVIERSRKPGRHMLIGFWANWRSGAGAVNTVFQRSLAQYGDSLCALSYSLDVDSNMLRAAIGRNGLEWDSYCDYFGFESPAVAQLGINNIPLIILLDPEGRILAVGSNFSAQIEPALKKAMRREP